MKVRVAVLGADTFWGAECIRMLSKHPQVELTALVSDTCSGQALGQVFPHLFELAHTPIQSFGSVDWKRVDCLLSGLPHTNAHRYFSALPDHVRGIDLSADFRYQDIDFYERHYGPHQAPALQPLAVYGLTEHFREAIKVARFVGVPGCYPTASLLALLPLVKAGHIEVDDIVIDAKSGVSGAGRGPDELHMYCEIADGVHPYRVARHRLAHEIELELSRAAGRQVEISFTPHMVPMNRGTLVTIYAKLAKGALLGTLREELTSRYRDESFIHLMPEGMAPSTRMVRGSNYCALNVFSERAHRRIVIVAAIDNVVKGAAGQAIQNLNLMYGMPEPTGLEQQSLFP